MNPHIPRTTDLFSDVSQAIAKHFEANHMNTYVVGRAADFRLDLTERLCEQVDAFVQANKPTDD